jgi:DNA-binding transcriptional MerR regulator
MQMSELSRRSGVPIPTIKYYLREGLMLPGTATAATRAEYGEPHVRRLRLIRALLEVGGLPVASIRRIIAALDDETVSLHELFGTVQYALPPRVAPRPGDADWQAAEREVDALITELGWTVEPDSPARGLLAGALVALDRLDQAPAGPSLRVYADVVRRLAGLEIDSVRLSAGVESAGLGQRTDALESVVAGMVLYERVIIALRRLAQEDASARRFRPAGVD